MSRRFTILLTVAVSVLSLAATAQASTISGTLSKSGYTVVAIGTNGKTTSVKAKGRSFKLTAPSATVTLQLVDPKGRYAGPVVVGTKGAKAIVGVRGGAKLGVVRIRKGYGVTARPLPAAMTVARRTAATKNGAPVGARGFGYIAKARGMRSFAPPSARQTQPLAPAPGPTADAGTNTLKAGLDPDKDGVPNAVDIDANGNGVIDMVDPNAPITGGLRIFVNYFANLDQTANVNASAASAAEIDTRLKDLLELVFTNVPTGAQLDCHGLPWCSTGGTGVIQPPGTFTPPWQGGVTLPFPSCCDADGDGNGLMSGTSQSMMGTTEFRIWPKQPSTGVRTGDIVTQVLTDGREVTGALGFVFTTVAATKSWSAGALSGTFSYPVAAGASGTQANPIPVATAPLTLTFWRPQRPAITSAGEAPGYVDIGGLQYDVQYFVGGASGGQAQCPTATLSTSDPSLTMTESGGAMPGYGRFVDGAADAPADPTNTLSFTVDLAACASAKGLSLSTGSVVNIGLEAYSPAGANDHVVQNLYFKIT